MRKIRLKENQGFSLVELTIMLGIIAVLASLAIPALSDSVRGMQLIGDARKISTTMSTAKLSAISQMTSYQLSFDIANNQWSLLKRNQSSGNYELQQAVNNLSDGMENSGIAFKATSGSAPTGFPTTSSTNITFNSRGTPNSVAIIYLSNEDTDFAVSASLSGKIQLWRYRNGQWSPI